MECSLRARLGALRSSRHRHWQTECALSSHQRSDDNQQEREGLRPIFPPHRGRTPAWLCDTSCLSNSVLSGAGHTENPKTATAYRVRLKHRVIWRQAVRSVVIV